MSTSNHFSYTISHLLRQNTRPNLNKPNEDYCIADGDHAIFLLADGVTRPHEEYRGEQESLASICARELCQTAYDYLLAHRTDPPEQALLAAMMAGNRRIHELNRQYTGNRPPSATFAGAILHNNLLYVSTCCDTVVLVLRKGVKFQLSECYNYGATKMGFSRDYVYQELHNNMEAPCGFGIFNGDSRLQDFLTVSSLVLEAGDRIILASDGFAECLRVLRAKDLAVLTPQGLLEASLEFDAPPFNHYADDKSCIMVDLISR